MRAGFDDAAFVHDDDAVGLAHGRQAVGNDEHGAALADVLHVALDDGLRLVVQGAGGFVQDEDAGVGEQGAGDGDALALPAREAAALFAHQGVVAFGQFADEVVGSGQLGGVHYGFNRGGGVGNGDVLAHAAVKEQVFLEHDAHLAAQLGGVDEADVDAVHQDAALLGGVQALH